MANEYVRYGMQRMRKERTGVRKTTVSIDEALLKEAMQAIGAESAKDAVQAGLELLVRRHRRKALQAERGTFEIDLDLKALERMRYDR